MSFNSLPFELVLFIASKARPEDAYNLLLFKGLSKKQEKEYLRVHSGNKKSIGSSQVDADQCWEAPGPGRDYEVFQPVYSLEDDLLPP